jgi:hypothetical protein
MGRHQADVAELEGVLEILCRPYYVGFHPVTFGSCRGVRVPRNPQMSTPCQLPYCHINICAIRIRSRTDVLICYASRRCLQ